MFLPQVALSPLMACTARATGGVGGAARGLFSAVSLPLPGVAVPTLRGPSVLEGGKPLFPSWGPITDQASRALVVAFSFLKHPNFERRLALRAPPFQPLPLSLKPAAFVPPDPPPTPPSQLSSGEKSGARQVHSFAIVLTPHSPPSSSPHPSQLRETSLSFRCAPACRQP